MYEWGDNVHAVAGVQVAACKEDANQANWKDNP